MSDEPKSWEQQPKEPAAAFRAFTAYRDMRNTRTVLKAYQQVQGNKKATQASGTWNTWVRVHCWAERAAAYDRHMERARLEGAEQGERDMARRWARRQRWLNEQQFRLGRRLMRKADRLSRAPTEPTTRVDDQGNATVVAPSDAMEFRRTASLAAEAASLARSAVQSGLGLVPPDEGPKAVDVTVLEAAEAQFEEWRAKQRALIAAAPQGSPEASPVPTGQAG